MGAQLKRLAGETATYGISTVLARLLNFLMVPYFTNNIFTKDVYGLYTYIYSIIPFALVVLTMGLESGYFRFAGRARNESEKREIFATNWGAVTLVSVIFMACVLLLLGPISHTMKLESNPSFVWLAGLIVMVDAVSAIPFARLREQGKAKRYVFLRLFSVIVNIVLCVFFLSVLPHLAANGILTSVYAEKYGVGYPLIANLIASAVTFFLLLPSCDKVIPRINPKLLKTIMIYSLPLLVSGIAGTANDFIDRILLRELMVGEQIDRDAALGVYGAVLRLAVIMTLFVQMYRLAAEPFFLANFRKDDFKKANAEAMKYYFIVTIFIFLFITLFADVIVLLIGKDFRGGQDLLPMILLGNMLSGVVLNLSFWYKQLEITKYAIIITGTGLAVTVAMNYFLIPRYAAWGAVTSRLICEVVMVAVSFWLNQRYFPVPYNLKRIGFYLIVGAALYVAGRVVMYADIVQLLKYGVYVVLCAMFLAVAIRKEDIDVRGMLNSIFGRIKI